MRIAIDVSPLETGHKVRGVGFYLTYLKNALLTYYPENKYVFFTGKLKESVDIVHYPYFDPFFLSLPFSKHNKTVVTVHDLTPLVFPQHFPAGIKGNIRWQIQKRNLQRVDAIITDSNASKKDIVTIVKVPDNKVTVAHLAAGEAFRKLSNSELQLEDLRKKYNLPNKFALYVGDITWNKNLVRLVQAIQKLEIPLIMVGKAITETNFDRENPWNKDRLAFEKLTHDDKKIIKLGFLPTEDVVRLYNSATVFVMPSLYEGFGLPVIEAMQCGCPVVTTSSGSLQEVAGDAAIYVDGYRVSSIMEGIKKVFFNENLQMNMSEKSLIQAKKFTWEQTAKETIRVYEKILNK
jgi:glycosyltransferase involved in cell wall biosynthesis